MVDGRSQHNSQLLLLMLSVIFVTARHPLKIVLQESIVLVNNHCPSSGSHPRQPALG